MARCDAAHRELDPLVNGDLQIGPLPAWTHVHGKAVWTVVAGPYTLLAGAWAQFGREAHAARAGLPDGPAGDVYVCDPADHTGDRETSLLTILYTPIR